MKRLNKKQIIIIISVAIVIIALAIAGIIFGINNGKKKETTKNDGKIESVEKDEADEEEEDETDAVEDETTENTTEQEANTQTPVVEEPKQETQQQTTTNTNQNQNQNNNNTGNNSGNNNSSTNNGTTNNTTSNNNQGNTGGNTGGSATGGIYSPGDSVSFERMNKCGTVLDGGMASPMVPVVRTPYSVSYWNGKTVIIASPTDGAWMYVLLAGWYADTTNVGSDETRPGYAEIPSLVKQCLETIAPEGGTELYNKVSALVSQYGSDYQVPTQGRISESIPGLYVTLEKGKNGLEIRFWAE